ncbi:MAG: acetolactate decarboxylase [Methanomassiliicoccus sp.]|nr:MAG: acetolactate decarboxylase [Methanomassiliicoccus sp.]
MTLTRSAYLTVSVAGMLLVAGLIGFWMAPGETQESDEYFQYSTYGRLVSGGYDGSLTISQMMDHGDFGIGTTEGIAGEMIIYDGTPYLADTELRPVEIPGQTITPFAMVTYYDAEQTFLISSGTNYSILRTTLDGEIPVQGQVYAFMIEAHFESITVRSIPAQVQPYPPLVGVIANQTVMEFLDLNGVMIGFRMPSGLGEVNIPGYHFHFLSEDMTVGGHVLEFSFTEAAVGMDQMETVNVTLLAP